MHRHRRLGLTHSLQIIEGLDTRCRHDCQKHQTKAPNKIPTHRMSSLSCTHPPVARTSMAYRPKPLTPSNRDMQICPTINCPLGRSSEMWIHPLVLAGSREVPGGKPRPSRTERD